MKSNYQHKFIPRRLKWVARSAVMAAVLALAVPGFSGITIQLTDVSVPPMTATQKQAFEDAAGLWKGSIKDNITIKLNVGFQNLGNGILGSTLPMMVTHNYATFRSALAGPNAQIASVVTDALPTSSLPITDLKGDRLASGITMTRANAKALGIGTGIDTQWGPPLPR